MIEKNIICLRNVSKLEFLTTPHIWKLINNCKKDNECKFAFCEKCNPCFDELFSEEQKQEVKHYLNNQPRKENVIVHPQRSQEWVWEKVKEKFSDKLHETKMVIHWDWIWILPNEKWKIKKLFAMIS